MDSQEQDMDFDTPEIWEDFSDEQLFENETEIISGGIIVSVKLVLQMFKQFTFLYIAYFNVVFVFRDYPIAENINPFIGYPC